MTEETKSLVVQVRDDVTALAERIEQMKKNGDARSGEVDKAVDLLVSRIDQLEARQNTPDAPVGEREDNEWRREFREYVVDLKVPKGGGFNRLAPEARAEIQAAVRKFGIRAFSTDNDANGGYLAPTAFSGELIKALTEISPVRQNASVRPTRSKETDYPTKNAYVSASWLSEGTAASDTQATDPLGNVTVTLQGMSAQITMSHLLEATAELPIEQDIRDDMVMQFEAAEGAAFVDGDGVGKPTGVVTRVVTDASQIQTSGHATEIDNIFKVKDLTTKVKDGYRRRGKFYMNFTTWNALGDLVDGGSRPYLNVGNQSLPDDMRLWGYPVVILPDMDDIGASAYPVLFGDMRFYRIHDLPETLLIRNPYSSPPNVTLSGFRWVGGNVLLTEAFAVLKVSA